MMRSLCRGMIAAGLLCLLAADNVNAKSLPGHRQQLWALATSGILTEYNSERLDTLAGADMTSKYVADERTLLAEWWTVHSREDLLKRLEWLKTKGQRAEFVKMGKIATSVSTAQFEEGIQQLSTNPKAVFKWRLARRYYPALGRSKSLLAWDYSRFVSMCRWGYAAGYLSEAEAWSMIMPVAVKLQLTFHSWRELGQNYLIGRQFWTGSTTAEYQADSVAAYNELLSDPASPWRTLPWKLNLAH